MPRLLDKRIGGLATDNIDAALIGATPGQVLQVGPDGNTVVLGPGTPGPTGPAGTSVGGPTGAAGAAGSIGRINFSLFATPGLSTWTVPLTTSRVKAVVIGGGGGGTVTDGLTDSVPIGYPRGGNGGIAVGQYTVTPGASYAITVGAGGNGLSLNPTLSNYYASPGSSSSFDVFASATGGGAGGYTPNTGDPLVDSIIGTDGVGNGGNIRNSVGGVVDTLWTTGYSPVNYTLTVTLANSGNTYQIPSSVYNISNGNAGFAGVVTTYQDSTYYYLAGGGVGGLVYLEWIE